MRRKWSFILAGVEKLHRDLSVGGLGLVRGTHGRKLKLQERLGRVEECGGVR